MIIYEIHVFSHFTVGGTGRSKLRKSVLDFRLNSSSASMLRERIAHSVSLFNRQGSQLERIDEQSAVGGEQRPSRYACISRAWFA